MSRHGHRLREDDAVDGIMSCPESGLRYRVEDGRMRCVDLDEEQVLPGELAVGDRTYDEYKSV